MSTTSVTDRLWFVRAGRHAAFIEEFRTRGFVGLGWRDVGPLGSTTTDEEIARLFEEHYPEERELTRAIWAAQLRRFLKEMRVGDGVITYDPSHRIYLLGTIESDPEWWEQDVARTRKVIWNEHVLRDHLSAYTRNALGSTALLFRLTTEATRELRRRAVPFFSLESLKPTHVDDAEGEAGEQLLLEETLLKSEEFIEDRIARLNERELSELVAALLRAMGYRTRQTGAQGMASQALFASPDGLGLQEPRLRVGVSHQPGLPLAGSVVRAFLADSRGADHLMYVSTGGFTREARLEAERAESEPTLVTLPQLREMLLQYYEQLDGTARQLLPLRRVFWPMP
ncbi:MAG: restriction endonuclease [Vicinamibacterales bacterium]